MELYAYSDSLLGHIVKFKSCRCIVLLTRMHAILAWALGWTMEFPSREEMNACSSRDMQAPNFESYDPCRMTRLTFLGGWGVWVTWKGKSWRIPTLYYIAKDLCINSRATQILVHPYSKELYYNLCIISHATIILWFLIHTKARTSSCNACICTPA